MERMKSLIHGSNADYPVTIYLADMTPEWAADILATQNTKNREIRPGHVNMLYKAFERGEYQLTHQGIAFDQEGTLIDGQHRLKAISKQEPGRVFPIVVFEGLPQEAFYVVDTTVAKRNLGDVAHIDKKYGETASFFARLYTGSARNSSVAFATKFIDFIKPEYDSIVNDVAPTPSNWGSATIRAAIITAMKLFGDPERSLSMYRTLVDGRHDTLPPVLLSLIDAKLNKEFSALQPMVQFLRVLNAFDPEAASHVSSGVSSERKIQLTALTSQLLANFVLSLEKAREEVVPN